MKRKSFDPVKIVLAALGGYGQYYLNTLLDGIPQGTVELVGGVDPYPERCPRLKELTERQVPVYDSLARFYDNYQADLAVIASPIHMHAAQSSTALQNGSCVLCEKPVAATIQEVDTLIRTRDQSSRWIMIGYQWAFSAAVQKLKKDISNGVFGRPLRLKSLCFWPRDYGYFQRNEWAGKQMTADGQWILDSPANNAMAHFLHCMLCVFETRPSQNDRLFDIKAELYRAYNIENFDTCAVRIRSGQEIEFLFIASHVTREETGPLLDFEFEKARIRYDAQSGFRALTESAEEIQYGFPDVDPQFLKLFRAIEQIHHLRKIECGLESARNQTLCINGMQESMTKIKPFPGEQIRFDEFENRLWVSGLSEALLNCYERFALPSEIGLPWASSGRRVNLLDYRFFPGGIPPDRGPSS